jgi:hypothetical protein
MLQCSVTGPIGHIPVTLKSQRNQRVAARKSAIGGGLQGFAAPALRVASLLHALRAAIIAKGI